MNVVERCSVHCTLYMYMGVLCFVVCLTLLASFFLPSHLSLKHVHVVIFCNFCAFVHVHVHVSTCNFCALVHVHVHVSTCNFCALVHVQVYKSYKI